MKQDILQQTITNMDISHSSLNIKQKHILADLIQKIQPYNTHQVFIHKVSQDRSLTYNCYLPGYFRIKIKNFTQMDLQKLTASMNATIIFTIDYGNLAQLNQTIITQLQQNLVVLFQTDDPLLLHQSDQQIQTKVKNDKKNKQITYTIRKVFKLRVQSDIFWSPFQIINLIFSASVQTLTIKKAKISNTNQNANIVLRVNLMDNSESFLKISYTEEGTFGYYDLAEEKLRCIYSNDRLDNVKDFYQLTKNKQKIKIIQKIDGIVNKKNKYQHVNHDNKSQNQILIKPKKNKKNIKPQFFQYAHFNIPMYKFPGLSLATIFLPLYLLSCVNLAIFFQSPSLGSRIASLATLMIAFVGLIPVIRGQIPPNPRVLFIQYLVYLQSINTLLVFIHSMHYRQVPPQQFQFIWYQSGLFLTAFIITVFTMIIIPLLLILHKFIWEPGYNIDVKDQQRKRLKFKPDEWTNEVCDFYFGYFKQIFNQQFIKLNDLLGIKDQLKQNSSLLKKDTQLVQITKRTKLV